MSVNYTNPLALPIISYNKLEISLKTFIKEYDRHLDLQKTIKRHSQRIPNSPN